MRVLLLGNMQSKFSYFLQQLYWKVGLLFKKNRKAYLSLYHQLGIMANNIKYYKLALRHKSKSIIFHDGRRLNNERLEFLGDAVVNMAVADYLFKHYKNAPEGMLTTMRTKLVNRQYLNKIAIEQNLDKLIRMEKRVFSPQNNVYGNSLEALVGAIYLDKGYKTSSQLIVKWLIKNPEYLNNIIQTETNHKAKLLEWCQKYNHKLSFNIISETKDKQNYMQFEIEVLVNDTAYGRGTGYSKKEAEQHACEEALKHITTD